MLHKLLLLLFSRAAEEEDLGGALPGRVALSAVFQSGARPPAVFQGGPCRAHVHQAGASSSAALGAS